MKEILKEKKSLIFKALDVIVVISLALLSIKKGGFYKSDAILFNFAICFIGFIYVAFKFILKEIEFKKLDFVFLLSFALSIFYLFPVIFKNYSSLNDALFEFIRYFNITIIYLIVKNSKNKKVYINGLIILGVVVCLFGIDSIAARHMEKILRLFNTGYLSTNLDRMSGTIQYANTFGVLIGVICLLLIKKFDTVKSSVLKLSFINFLCYIFISSIILTSSRYLMLVFLVFLIILICKVIKNKFLTITYIFIDILLSFFMYAFIIDLYGKNKLYLIYVLFLMLILAISMLISLLLNKILLKGNIKKIILIFAGTLILSSTIYVFLNFILYKPVILNEKDNSYEAYIYLNDKDFKSIRLNTDDSNFEIKLNVYGVKKDDTSTLIGSYDLYYENLNTINIDVPNEFKCLKLDLSLKKGNVRLNSIYVNDKNYAVSYYLIPYNFIVRVLDSIYGSNSTSLRYTYIKDALKINTLNVKNFIFGCGGEAFRNMYNSVKEINYISTEVHSSFIQILVESGILGFASVMFLIIYVFINAKKSEEKIAFLLLVVHSIFDLNFSYMIILAIFGVMLGLQDYDYGKVGNKFSKKIMVFLYGFICVFSLYLSVRLLFVYKASKMSINLDLLEDVNKLEDEIRYANKKYRFDKTEFENLKNLVILKENHILLLKQNFEDENVIIIKNEINDIYNLLNEIRKNNSYNREAIYFVCEKYYDNIENFAYLFLEENSYANTKYKDIIYKMLEDLRNKYKINDSTIKKIDYLEKIYK